MGWEESMGGREEEAWKRINVTLVGAESGANECIEMGRGDDGTCVHCRCRQ
jgi:hypothetical protein